MQSSSWLLRLCVLAELFTNQHSMLADEMDTVPATPLPFDYRQKENFMDNGRQSVPRSSPDEDFSRFYGHKGQVVGPEKPWLRYPERTVSSVFGEGLGWTLLATGLSIVFLILLVIWCCYKNHQPLQGARGRVATLELGNMIPVIHIEPPSDDEED